MRPVVVSREESAAPAGLLSDEPVGQRFFVLSTAAASLVALALAGATLGREPLCFLPPVQPARRLDAPWGAGEPFVSPLARLLALGGGARLLARPRASERACASAAARGASGASGAASRSAS
jgi:hypothetical protein